MYTEFFGLRQAPFSIAPDPRYLFMSERHREALAHLLYGLQGGGGFVLLTGEIGAGKTTVCRCFLEQIPAHCHVAYIFNPKLTVTELLKTVCEEYRIELGPVEPTTVKPFVDALNAFLLRTHAAGEHTVLIIDEAQNLSAEVLEQLRLLTNLETHERKLLQIILIGQPELRTMLAAPELEQLAQRVIARFHLQALSAPETAQYVRHRLGVAGFDAGAALPFDRAALQRIQRLSRGVPRRINLLCDRALLGAYAQGRRQVDRLTLDKAAAEVFDSGQPDRAAPGARRGMWALLGGAAALTAAAAAAAGFALLTRPPQPAAAPAASAVAASAPAPVAVAASAASAVAAPEPIDPSATITLALSKEGDAWRELAAAWQIDLPADDEGAAQRCEALQRQDVRCFNSSEGLALLRLLGRPSILTLHDGSGQPSYVTLLSLSDQHATVRAGPRTQTVSLLALSRQWRGEFATLWRAPPGYPGKMAPGPALDWLDARLATVFGDSPSAPGARKTYDAALQARVAAFQRTQGLRSDGRAGPITLMQLNRAAGVDEPRLQTATP